MIDKYIDKLNSLNVDLDNSLDDYLDDENKLCQAIISLNGKIKFVTSIPVDTSGAALYQLVSSRYNLPPNAFYITNRLNNNRIINDINYMPFTISKCDNYMVNSDKFLDVQTRLPGGGVMKRVFKAIFKAIFAVFNPIIAPLAAIANAFLLLVKAIIFIIALIIWFFKLMVWFFVQFLPSLPLDLILLVKQLTTLLLTTFVQTFSQKLKRLTNWFGRNTIYGMSAGWDNARDSNQTPENSTGMDPKSCQQHCYRAPDGSVPFGLVVVTVLCPPAGVFMEFGLLGWLKILVCFLLTLIFYFPGLIYALILMYT